MSIRLANQADLAAIVAIYNETIPSRMVTADTEPTTVDEKQAWFDSHNERRPIYVYEQAEQVSAWLSYKSFYGRPAYDGTVEISIYLASAVQGRGLGKQLLTFAEQQAKMLNISVLLAFIFSHNIPSIKLFQRFEYQTWGVLPNIATMDGQKYSLTILGKNL
ncbi:MAG: GNAT family N-acetyltransferase [Pseudoalteromonas sp.]|uniref:GNAT family N-acetyltransferase n=1 Tax=unclassified Pseudoalteromonas TaxID=194690 RepID=UPI003F9AED19